MMTLQTAPVYATLKLGNRFESLLNCRWKGQLRKCDLTAVARFWQYYSRSGDSNNAGESQGGAFAVLI